MNALAFALVGAMVASGIYGFVWAVRGTEVDLAAPGRRDSGLREQVGAQFSHLGLRLVCAVAGFAVAWMATGWPVLAAIGLVGGFLAPSLLGSTARRKRHEAKLEAIATWTEQLRDMISGASELEEAIIHSAHVAPGAIRADVDWLVGALAGGMSPRTALRRFANRIDDAVADKVVAALIMAFEGTVASVADLLSRLASSTREEVRMRQRVDVSRSGTRTAVRGMAAFTALFLAGLIMFNRPYVETYQSFAGQLTLLVVAGLFAGSFTWLARASRPVRPERFLVAGSARQVGHHDDETASRPVAWAEGPNQVGAPRIPHREVWS